MRANQSIQFLAVSLLLSCVAGCGADGIVQGPAPTDTTTTPVVPLSTPIVSVTIANKTLSILTYGSTSSVTAAVIDANNVTRTDRPVTWKSSNVSIATVTQTGTLTAQLRGTGPGTVTITASVDGKSDAMTFQVWSEQAFIYSAATGITPIALPAGVATSQALGINDLGQVVGSMTLTTGGRHAFLWSATEGTLDLGGFAGVDLSKGLGSVATAINTSGQVTGWTMASDFTYHAFLWSKSTGMTDLGKLPGTLHTFGNAINDKGDVVGEMWTGDAIRPFLWTKSAGLKLVGTLQDLPARAAGINDAGLIVGMTIPPGDVYGFEWIDGVVWTPNGTIINLTNCPVGSECSASAVNRAGAVTGMNVLGVAYTWTQSGGMQTIGAFGAQGTAINDVGQIAGYAYGNGNGAFLWSATTGRIIIGVLPNRSVSYATGINNSGQVVGYSQ